MLKRKTLSDLRDSLRELEQKYKLILPRLQSLARTIEDNALPDTINLRETGSSISDLTVLAERINYLCSQALQKEYAAGTHISEVDEAISDALVLSEYILTATRMKNIHFHDEAVEDLYLSLRGCIAGILDGDKKDPDFLGKVDLFHKGLLSTDPVEMTDIFRQLMGTFDARILAAIMTKDFQFEEDDTLSQEDTDKDREQSKEGSGESADISLSESDTAEEGISSVADDSGRLMAEGEQLSFDLYLPEEDSDVDDLAEEMPSGISADTFDETNDEVNEVNEDNEDNEDNAVDTGAEEDSSAAGSSVLTEAPVSHDKEEYTGQESLRAEDTTGNVLTEAGEETGLEHPASLEDVPEEEPKEEIVPAGPIEIIEGGARIAFLTGTEGIDEIPEGFYITDETGMAEVVDFKYDEYDGYRAVTLAYARVGLPACALAYVHSAAASCSAEVKERVLNLEKQAALAYADPASDNDYSPASLLDVFNNEDRDRDLFGAAALRCALSDIPVYEYDRKKIEELLRADFVGEECSQNLRHLFSRLCTFKEENGQSFLSLIKGRAATVEAKERMQELEKDLVSYEASVKNSYQPKNPLIAIMRAVGYDHLVSIIRNAVYAKDVHTEADKLEAFLLENRLVKKKKKAEVYEVDSDGVKAYEAAFWDDFCSAHPEGFMGYTSIRGLNDRGKAVPVIKYYSDAVSLMIKCLSVMRGSAECFIGGIQAAEEKRATFEESLSLLTENAALVIAQTANAALDVIRTGKDEDNRGLYLEFLWTKAVPLDGGTFLLRDDLPKGTLVDRKDLLASHIDGEAMPVPATVQELFADDNIYKGLIRKKYLESAGSEIANMESFDIEEYVSYAKERGDASCREFIRKATLALDYGQITRERYNKYTDTVFAWWDWAASLREFGTLEAVLERLEDIFDEERMAAVEKAASQFEGDSQADTVCRKILEETEDIVLAQYAFYNKTVRTAYKDAAETDRLSVARSYLESYKALSEKAADNRRRFGDIFRTKDGKIRLAETWPEGKLITNDRVKNYLEALGFTNISVSGHKMEKLAFALYDIRANAPDNAKNTILSDVDESGAAFVYIPGEFSAEEVDQTLRAMEKTRKPVFISANYSCPEWLRREVSEVVRKKRPEYPVILIDRVLNAFLCGQKESDYAPILANLTTVCLYAPNIISNEKHVDKGMLIQERTSVYAIPDGEGVEILYGTCRSGRSAAMRFASQLAGKEENTKAVYTSISGLGRKQAAVCISKALIREGILTGSATESWPTLLKNLRNRLKRKNGSGKDKLVLLVDDADTFLLEDKGIGYAILSSIVEEAERKEAILKVIFMVRDDTRITIAPDEAAGKLLGTRIPFKLDLKHAVIWAVRMLASAGISVKDSGRKILLHIIAACAGNTASFADAVSAILDAANAMEERSTLTLLDTDLYSAALCGSSVYEKRCDTFASMVGHPSSVFSGLCYSLASLTGTDSHKSAAVTDIIDEAESFGFKAFSKDNASKAYVAAEAVKVLRGIGIIDAAVKDEYFFQTDAFAQYFAATKAEAEEKILEIMEHQEK